MTSEIDCPCGAVRMQLTGEPAAQFYCHCDDCRAVHGAEFVAVAAYPAECVTVIRGTTTEWKLKVNTRSSCAQCGTRLFAQRPELPIRGVNAYLLAEGLFRPAFHIFCAFARRPVDDGLPHFRTVPAAFGGVDDCVEW